MNQLHKIFFITILLFYAFLSISQNLAKRISKGDELFKQGKYYSASVLYRSVLENEYTNSLAYKYAEACRLNYNYPEAEEYYLKVAIENNEKYPLLYFNLANVQKGLGKYMQARRNFNRFINLYKTDNFYRKKAMHEIISCQNAFEISCRKKSVLLNHCDSTINSVWSEFEIYEIDSNKILLSGMRPDTTKETKELKSAIYLINKKLKTDSLFLSSYNDNQDYDISGFCFNSAKTYIFFTRCEFYNNKRRCNIWKGKYKNNKVSEIKKLSSVVNFPGSNSIQPSISKIDGRDIMFFASNREGGYGKYDIWYSTVYDDGSVSSAQNLGKQINTIDNEITPYYDSKHEKLYFSSKWFNNLGGFDVFVSQGKLDYWTEPENLGLPVNSSYNDIYFRINEKHTNAYLSSNRSESFTEKEGNCCNDIFKFQIPKENEPKLVDVNRIQKQMKQLIPITLYFHNDEPNPKTRDTTTNLTYEETYLKYTAMIEEYENEYSKGLQKEDKEKAVKQINDFFYNKVDYGFKKLVEFNYMLKDLLEDGEKVEITIKGYASPLNSTDYNINLSKRRIQSLINYYNKVNSGEFQKYIKNRQLSFVREAFGEDTADKNISDDYFDVKNSVYSPAAANERKIKVIAVSFDK